MSMMARAVCLVSLLCLGLFIQSSSAAWAQFHGPAYQLKNYRETPRDFTCRSFQSNGGLIELASGLSRTIGCYEYTCPASGVMQRRQKC